MRVYLDVCCLQRPTDEATDPRIVNEADAVRTILADVQAGNVELLDSEPLRNEIDVNPDEVRRLQAMEYLDQSAETIMLTDEIMSRAEGYEMVGMKTFDALHTACAVAGMADYFLTCDSQLIRVARRVNTHMTVVCSPVEFPWGDFS